jgi:hypothetical protein
VNGPDDTPAAPTEKKPRDPRRAARIALGVAVLAASLALLALYHARNWALVRDAVLHVARTLFSLPVP